MTRTPAEYDAYHALLNLSPRAPVADIQRAKRRLALRYHPDKIQDERLRLDFEERTKEIFNACDELIAYWEEFNEAPPSEIPDRERQEALRKANLPIFLPELEKTFLHDLVDWLDAHDRTGAFYLGMFLALLLESFSIVRALVSVFLPAEIASTASCGWLILAVVAVQYYVLAHGLHSFTELYRLDLSRASRRLSAQSDQVRIDVYKILDRHSRSDRRWNHREPRADPADATTHLSSRLEFRKKLFRTLEIRYAITFCIKVKAASRGASCEVAYWFEREATAPWWPPARAIITHLERDLKASFGI